MSWVVHELGHWIWAETLKSQLTHTLGFGLKLLYHTPVRLYFVRHLFFLISKEDLFKIIKRSYPSILEIYSKWPKQLNTQITNIHKTWTEKIEWLPMIDMQSNNVLKKKSFKLSIVLSKIFKTPVVSLPSNAPHQKMRDSVFFSLMSNIYFNQ